MNRQALVCRNILEKPDITQREMAKNMDISLGTVNGLVKECLAEGYIAEEENGKEKYLILLEKGKELRLPHCLDQELGEIAVRVKMLVKRRRTKRPRDLYYTLVLALGADCVA